MKRFFMITLLVMAVMDVLQAQTPDFKVKFTVTEATCFNNGKIAYALVDDGGNALDSASVASRDLSEVRIYYKVGAGDSVFYGDYNAGGWDTLVIDHGVYTVGVEAAWWDGSDFVKLDTHRVITVNTNYSKPKASALYVTAQSTDGYGKHPTLSCAATGRIQLRIEDGRFPYTVTVRNHNTHDSLRTVVFNDYMYSGTNQEKYNYKYYYSVDSLPAGTWDFYVVDGCDYGLPRTTQDVKTIALPKLSNIEVYASSGNFADSNVVRINAVLDKYYGYYNYLLEGYVQYRFVYDGNPGSWKPFKANASSEKTLLLDTASAYSSYCGLWGKTINFEYKVAGCGLDQTITKSFTYSKPNGSHFEKNSHTATDSLIAAVNACNKISYHHTSDHTIRYYHKDYGYSPGAVHDADHFFQRYHYTHPIVWTYTDNNTGTIIKRDTVGDISTLSHLTAKEVENRYGSFQSSPITLNVTRTLVDAKGCTLYTTTDNLTYAYSQSTGGSQWVMYDNSNVEDHCCTKVRSISFDEENHPTLNTGTTTIRLVRSPYNNRYNCTAVYDHSTKTFTVTKDDLMNTAVVAFGNEGHTYSFHDYCLPSGPYEFEITTPCTTLTMKRNLKFSDIYSTEMTEDPVLAYHQECTDRYIKYTAGKYSQVARNTSQTTGLELAPVYTDLTTYYTIISGPVGGYDHNVLHRVGSDSARISIPGTYIVRISPDPNRALCDQPHYFDTIVYDGATVDFEYAYALLCDHTCTSGNVYVLGSNGTEPYTYTLYSQKDKQGVVLGTNNTGVFLGVPMTHDSIFSCKVEDDCGSYYHVNIMPSMLADMQKVWFDGGLREKTTCEGTTIGLNALEQYNIFSYTWEYPDGTTETGSKKEVFIPRGADEGWYKVTVLNTGCGFVLTDSIYLRVDTAPSVALAGGGTVCPGEDVAVTFTPHSQYNTTTPISFTVAYANATGTEKRTYSAVSGMSVTDTYATNTDAKIYTVSINDGRCDYTPADDTIRVYTRTDISHSCHILSRHDTACYNGDAHLQAKSDLAVPYTLRWYDDYELTLLRKEELMTDPDAWSTLDTDYLTQRAIVYVSVARDGSCPTVYGVPTHTVNMTDGSTTMQCGQTYRLYDSGGPAGDYATGSQPVQYTFSTGDGRPVTLHFDELSLSTSAHLWIFSGNTTHKDSLLCELTAGVPNPGMVVARGDALTMLFMAGMVAAPGWSAIVEPMPGLAIADVRPENKVTFSYEVCQSRTNDWMTTYGNPYNIAPDVATVAELNDAMHNGRSVPYTFKKTLPKADQYGCDSTVTFYLTVLPPSRHDTTIVTTNMHGGSCTWHGKTYTKSGRDYFYMTLPDGCDSVDVLDFIILQIDTSDNKFCEGDTTVMGVSVKEPDMSWRGDTKLPAVNIGDIVCADGTIMNVDTFVKNYSSYGKLPMGVVFYVDNSGLHGLMVALRDACQVCAVATNSNIVSVLPKYNTRAEAIMDIDGLGNTLKLKSKAETFNSNGFASNTPAVYACYYYDHTTLSTGTDSLGWYLPALGELFQLWASRPEVNYSLNKLGNSAAISSAFSKYIRQLAIPDPSWKGRSSYYWYYWSSTGSNVRTAYSNTSALTVWLRGGWWYSLQTSPPYKTNDGLGGGYPFVARAIHSF